MRSVWNTLSELFDVLPQGSKTFYLWYAIATGLLSLLDAAALALIVLIATPVVSGQSVSLPVVGEIDSSLTIWLLVTVCALFILKGILALSLHWFATRRFARYELEVGNQLFRAYIFSDWETRSQLSTAEATRIVDGSMANTNLGFILPLSQVPGNALTFLSTLLVLIWAQPMSALIALVYLSAISIFMIAVVSRQTRLAGKHNRAYGYKVATLMTEMIEALKEVTLRDKLGEIEQVVSSNRRIATRARANISFLGLIPKYFLEAALIGGFILIGGFSFFHGGVNKAIFSVALFGVTGFRMLPAMTGLQSSINTASANEFYARDVIKYLKDAQDEEHQVVQKKEDQAVLSSSPKSLTLRDVSFRYPGSDHEVLKNLNLEVPFGSSLAIVGPSGAGKSTLIDILLGLSHPQTGQISIDELPLEKVLNQWRSRVGYVPQKVALFDASIAQNVALTWTQDYDADQVRQALDKANLQELQDKGRDLTEKIGERGAAVSGGQQQRLGIARALYSDPLVIVMDEATSALDTATENRITDSMKSLQGEVTFITVAHRLATIKDYDQVCYLDQGRILGQGSFVEVTEQVPEFKHQAALAGLL